MISSGNLSKPKSIAFVTPRYGDGVVGGSEAVMAEAARGLAERGHKVEVLTTCARSHYTWANEFEPGLFEDRGINVRRFAAVTSRSKVFTADLERRVIGGENLTFEQEMAWVNGRFRVPDLYSYLSLNCNSYDAILLSPYLFWSTIYCAQIAPEKSIVMPCLHDEAYAWLDVVGHMLSTVAGVWFLSEPEHQLGHRVAPGIAAHHAVVGAAVQIPATYDPTGFCRSHGLERPYVLYAGRREDGKGWKDLLAGYAGAIARRDLPFDLVTIGVGSPDVPDVLRSRVIDLGFLDDDDVPSAFAGASALIQPSRNESFSRTVMEAWLAETPVVAAAASEVVTWHCERSGGGLTYSDEIELGECLTVLAEAPQVAKSLAKRGRDYVLANYTWEIVLDAMESSLDDVIGAVR